MASAAGRTDPRDDRENDVLACDTEPECALDVDAHGLRLALPECLRRQHVRDLGRADTEGETAERAVRRRMAVTAHERDAGQRDALLGSDHVHDALPPIADVEDGDAGCRCVLAEADDHALVIGVRDRGLVARIGRHVVVGRREGPLGMADLHAVGGEAPEGIVRAVVQQMAIDVEQRIAIGAIDDDMAPPDLLEHCRRASALSLCHAASSLHGRRGRGAAVVLWEAL